MTTEGIITAVCTGLLLITGIVCSPCSRALADEGYSIIQLSTPRSLPEAPPFGLLPPGDMISLNDGGDLIIRCGLTTVTIAYAPAEDQSGRNRPVAQMHPQSDCPPISGISVKVSIMF